jgi:hypothetical protein
MPVRRVHCAGRDGWSHDLEQGEVAPLSRALGTFCWVRLALATGIPHLVALAHIHLPVGITFSFAFLAPFLIASLSSVLKTVRDLTLCQKINDSKRKRTDMKSVGGRILAGSVQGKDDFIENIDDVCIHYDGGRVAANESLKSEIRARGVRKTTKQTELDRKTIREILNGKKVKASTLAKVVVGMRQE